MPIPNLIPYGLSILITISGTPAFWLPQVKQKYDEISPDEAATGREQP